MSGASNGGSVRFVDWPDVRRGRWDISGRIPPERVLIHWACVEDDHIEYDWQKAETSAILLTHGLGPLEFQVFA